MNSLLLLVFLVVFVLLGAPIAFVMVALPTVYILVTGALPLVTIPYQMFEAIAHVPLVAIPFFLLTGELMNQARITERLLELARELVGRVRGGLAQVSVVVSMFFAGMNGSAVADAATVGSLLIPAMKKDGYSAAFASGLIAVCGTIGGIIPPSVIMVLLASGLNLSVGGLFAAGILPGLLVGALLMLYCYAFATVNAVGRYEAPFSVRRLWRAFMRAGLATLVPVVLVGGILGGVFGTVEAGAITAVVAYLIGALGYRTLGWPQFKQAVTAAMRSTASVFMVIAAAGPFGWMLNRLGALNFVESWLLGFSDTPILFALVVLLFVLAAGMVMDVVANVVILGPLLVKVMVVSGFNIYQAALVVCVGFLLGTVTPPVGISLFTVSAIARERIERVSRAALPFIAIEVVVLGLLMVVPELSLAIPRALGFLK